MVVLLTERIAPDRTSEVMKISRSREEDWIFIVIIEGIAKSH